MLLPIMDVAMGSDLIDEPPKLLPIMDVAMGSDLRDEPPRLPDTDIAIGSDFKDEPAILPVVDAVIGSVLEEASPRLLPIMDVLIESVFGMELPEYEPIVEEVMGSDLGSLRLPALAAVLPPRLPNVEVVMESLAAVVLGSGFTAVAGGAVAAEGALVAVGAVTAEGTVIAEGALVADVVPAEAVVVAGSAGVVPFVVAGTEGSGLRGAGFGAANQTSGKIALRTETAATSTQSKTPPPQASYHPPYNARTEETG